MKISKLQTYRLDKFILGSLVLLKNKKTSKFQASTTWTVFLLSDLVASRSKWPKIWTFFSYGDPFKSADCGYKQHVYFFNSTLPNKFTFNNSRKYKKVKLKSQITYIKDGFKQEIFILAEKKCIWTAENFKGNKRKVRERNFSLIASISDQLEPK